MVMGPSICAVVLACVAVACAPPSSQAQEQAAQPSMFEQPGESGAVDVARRLLALTRVRVAAPSWSSVGVPSMAPLLDGRAVRVVLRAAGEAGLPGSAGVAGVTSATSSAATDAGSGLGMQAFQRAVDDAIAKLRESAGQRDVPASEVTISIEVAEPAIDVIAATYAELDERCRPGLDGLRLTIAGDDPSGNAGSGTTTWWSFPSQQLLAGDTPSRAGLSLISQATGDPALALAGVEGHELRDLAASRSVQFARFGVAHVAELTPGGAGVMLHRGGVVVGAREITRESIASLSTSIARELCARVRMEPQGMRVRAVVQPAVERDRGLVEAQDAGTIQVALLCVALLRTGDEGSERVAGELLGDMLARGYGAVDGAASPAVAAAVALALHEYFATTPEPRVWALSARAGVLDVLREGFDAKESAWSPRVPDAARGLVALAMVRCSTSSSWDGVAPDLTLDDARAVTRAAYRTDAPSLLVAQMPWLGWAEVELARQEPGNVTPSPLPAAGALRQMRDALLARQVRFEALDVLGEDSEGGFLLATRDGGASGVLGPTWQTARPLAFLATMVREPGLTDEKERLAQLARVLAGVRFLRQLVADEAVMHAAPWAMARGGGLGGGLWGVRNATWDQRQSLEAAVMTLLTLQETLATIDALSGPLQTAPESPKMP